MASFELQVDVDIAELEAAWNSAELTRRRKDFTDSVADMMEPYVPMQYGQLRSRGNRSIGDGTITYTAEYSGYVYAMPDSYNYTTAGTSGHWDEKFADKDSEKLIKAAEELLMQGIS